MARTELPNGVILPAEYSDDWYEDMTSNLTKLDDVIGSDSEKLNADGVYFLRMSSAALTDSGTGNFSDLNSSYKIKTGDLVLDSGRKLYQIVSVDSTNSTFSVGNSLFKVTAESDLAPVAESGDYGDLDNRPDLNPYDQHLANTDIHVTAADKQKWNNGVTQSYVFRYSSTAVVPNSTIAYSTIDNTDNIKSGDKILDVDGKLFEITAVDTTNQTVTVGSALIDLALDANVVHTSGNETIGGEKTFANNTMVVGRATDGISVIQLVNSDVVGDSASGKSGFEVYGTSVSDAHKIGGLTVGEYSNNSGAYARIEVNRTVSGVKSSNEIRNLIRSDGTKELTATIDNDCKLGNAFLRWSKIYGTEYYYGSNNVEFSTKFVTTDTAQTISGAKTFSEDVVIGNSDTTQSSKRLVLRSYKASLSGSNSDNWGINFNAGTSYAVAINAHKSTDGAQGLTYTVRTQDSNNNIFTSSYRFRVFIDGNSVLEPDVDNNVSLGRSTNRWKDCQTKLINGLTPSSLSMPATTGTVDISGYVTDLTGNTVNTYSPVANGYIVITCNSTDVDYIKMSNNLDFVSVVDNTNNQFTSGLLGVWQPCVAGIGVQIRIKASALNSAKFIPCQGNV